ncbi:MAG TPA: SGNH hydrolase domain-containing protein [Acidimicrobiales bacterium]|nr:SGNH hydrolase domain-containing protein [Acidimicrobiales bacterium]
MLVALLASTVTYVLVENPVRHARPLLRLRWASVGLGAGLTAVAFGVVTLTSGVAGGSGIAARAVAAATTGNGPGASLSTVLSLVAASGQIRTVPPHLAPPLSLAVTEPLSNLGVPPLNTGCWPSESQATVPTCVFGDRTGNHTMVLYGDSHAGMWFQALDDIATRSHWKLVVLSKGSCPAALVPTHAVGSTGEWVACDRWHQYAVDRINRIDPDLLLISQASWYETPTGTEYTAMQWRRPLEQLFRAITAPKTAKVVIGDMPWSRGPDCVAQHVSDVQACSGAPITSYLNVERRAALAEGVRYISVTPWFCTKACSPIIGHYSAYFLTNHVAVGYSRFLEGVLAQSLDLQRFG